MFDAFVWLLAVELLGLLAFPLTFLLFRRLPDRGFTVSKPLALILFSYVLWVLGLTNIIPNTQFTIIGILVATAVISALLWRKSGSKILGFFREEWRFLMAAEAVFLAFFVLWVAITSESPSISHTEKPMDFGFLNAVLQSRFFPPEDPWLAGQPISYYYFGHFIIAMVTKLTGITSAVGYNLGISIIPALLATGSLGLMYNLIRLSGSSKAWAVSFALAAPAMITLLGNLEGVLEFIHNQGWGTHSFWDWIGIKGLEGLDRGAGPSAFPSDPWWWWRASRVIDTLVDGQSVDYTITEFPFFSFLLGDLHPHVLALPFVVLGLSLCLNLFLSKDPPGIGWVHKRPLESLSVAFFLGSLAFINTWDFPMLAAILGAVILAKSYAAQEGDLAKATAKAGLMFAPLILLSVAAFLPFYLDFGSQATGILPLRGNSTRPFLFFLVIGLFSFLSISLVLRQLWSLEFGGGSLNSLDRQDQSGDPSGDSTAAVVIGISAISPLALWIITVWIWTLLTDGASMEVWDVVSRTIWVLPGLAFAGIAGYSALRRYRLDMNAASVFPLILFTVAFSFIVGAELFFVADSFGVGFRRMNTVFKVYYQAWLLLGLVGTYSISYWFSGPSPVRNAPHFMIWARFGKAANYMWAGIVVVLILASLYYPLGAVLDRTGWFGQSNPRANNTLDGLAFIKNDRPGEYDAIQWLRDEAPWGRVAEATGGDYSEYGRISSSTGLPTILGWQGHELQWRGSSMPYEGREEDIATIYDSESEDDVRQILEKYEVRYVYEGQRERTTYRTTNLAHFDNLLRVAFTAQGVIIYEIIP